IFSRYLKSCAEELERIIGVVSGELEFATCSGCAEETVATASTSLGAAEYALILGRNIAYVSRIEKIDLRSMDIAQVLLDSFVLFQRYFNSLNLTANLVVESSKLIEIDPNATHQMIACLLARAGRSMNAGQGLTLTLKHSERWAEIAIEQGGGKLPAADDL